MVKGRIGEMYVRVVRPLSLDGLRIPSSCRLMTTPSQVPFSCMVVRCVLLEGACCGMEGVMLASSVVLAREGCLQAHLYRVCEIRLCPEYSKTVFGQNRSPTARSSPREVRASHYFARCCLLVLPSGWIDSVTVGVGSVSMMLLLHV